ncbi:START domain-containing protein 10-like [Varanus komodoensis]|nr:START domain-containing protein 10-like [Varanus komodoensis]
MEPVRLPDEDAFRAFQEECVADLGWHCRYNREGIAVWGQPPPQGDFTVHRVKGRIHMPDVLAQTAYDVLHDTEYRKKWDMNVIGTHEIARLSDNADVGYYSWKCPKPLKNRDVVALRSWRVLDDSYIILNFSVKHPEYPPSKDLVRAVSILTGYLVKPTGPSSCILTYLAQVDLKGKDASYRYARVARCQSLQRTVSFLRTIPCSCIKGDGPSERDLEVGLGRLSYTSGGHSICTRFTITGLGLEEQSVLA